MLFLESLKVMGLGMLGIFTVTVALVLIMKLLTKLFPAVRSDKESQEERAGESEQSGSDTDKNP